jgi:signal transduction histidine kinase
MDPVPDPTMVPTPTTLSDPRRLAAVAAAIPGADAGGELTAYPSLASVAARVLDTPVGLVGFLDARREVIAGSRGLAEPWRSRGELPLEYSFCRHLIESDEPLLIVDAREDPRVRDSPAIDRLGAVSYAGAPVIDGEAGVLGAVCAIDSVPRGWGASDADLLAELAAIAAAEAGNRASRPVRRDAGARRADASSRGSDDVVAMVTHDLRNPLGAIQMCASLLRDAGEDRRDETRRWLEIILRSVGQMRQLVDGLVDLSSVEAESFAVSPARASVGELVRDAVDLMRPAATARGVELRTRVADAGEAWIDAAQLLRVVSNLLGNAVKFTPPGGHVFLAVERDERDIRFTVEDTGPGIPAHELTHVFERYWQGRSGDRRGAGLGLAIARGIVEAHGGRIYAASEPGRGARFTFTVPARPGAGER